MKQLLSVILIVMLMTAVSGAMLNGTMAKFFDTEVSTNNFMCAGDRTLELNSGAVVVEYGMPCKTYSEVFTLVNDGSLDGVATLHIPRIDDPEGRWKGLVCEEAGTVLGQVWDGLSYRDFTGNEPIGSGVATSEPELMAEEGGYLGNIYIPGLGVDAGSDSGPSYWIMSKHIDVIVWFDQNGDGDFDDPGELILGDPTGVNPEKLYDIACTEYELGIIPGSMVLSEKGGGWGSFSTYTIGSNPGITIPLIAGQNIEVGQVKITDDTNNLYVTYDTTESGWTMSETHLYVGTEPPEKMAPGKFDFKHENLGCVTVDTYSIPIQYSGEIYIVAHATGCDRETAWAQGVGRLFKIALHLQQLEDPAWDGINYMDYDADGDVDEDDAQKRWWPTNVFQGDKCTFDMVFNLNRPDEYSTKVKKIK